VAGSAICGGNAYSGRTPVDEKPHEATLRCCAWSRRGSRGASPNRSFFHAGSLAWPKEDLDRIRSVAATNQHGSLAEGFWS
jgi:hypothetical protein